MQNKLPVKLAKGGIKMRLNVNPLESVGDVKFGMTREEVRSWI
jgi:hypothetical protein